MRKYKTVSGDTWDMIAFRIYPEDSYREYIPLMTELNSEYADIEIFPAGLELSMPDEIKTTGANIPPWRR